MYQPSIRARVYQTSIRTRVYQTRFRARVYQTSIRTPVYQTRFRAGGYQTRIRAASRLGSAPVGTRLGYAHKNCTSVYQTPRSIQSSDRGILSNRINNRKNLTRIRGTNYLCLECYLFCQMNLLLKFSGIVARRSWPWSAFLSAKNN